MRINTAIRILILGFIEVLCLSVAYGLDISDKHLHLNYHSKEYEIQQYETTPALNIYSLQNWKEPEPIVLIKDKNRKVIKVITNDSSAYYPDLHLYDLNKDGHDDIILFWNIGPTPAQIVEVWMNKNNIDFEKGFEIFAGRGAEFKVADNIPTLSLNIYTDYKENKGTRQKGTGNIATCPNMTRP